MIFSPQKLVAGITLGSFVCSMILSPVHVAVAGYLPDATDISEYLKDARATTNKALDNTDVTDVVNSELFKLSIGTISETVPAVIGCSGIVNTVQKSMTAFLSPAEKTASSFNIQESLENGSAIGRSGIDITDTSDFDTSSSIADKVPTSDKSAHETLHAIEIKEAAIKKEAEQATLRQECIDGVAYTLAKNQLAKMTQSTVNWINSGFNGDPLYIQDRGSYFQSLADGQLLNLVGPLASIQNQYIYPFGRELARSLISSQKYKYDTAAHSTLYKSLEEGATTKDFANDFSKGGWDGWLSLTQNDQNNPLGFGIMTSQELAERITKQQEDAKADLLEGKGFLSKKECVEWAKNDLADGGAPANPDDNGTLGRECIKWKTVTPGSVIQDQASSSLTSSTRQLELADSLNESLSAVFQALVNQMMSQGLSSLSSFSIKNSQNQQSAGNPGGPGSNRIYDSNGIDITNLNNTIGKSGNVLSVNKGQGWYSVGGTFDITKDLGDIRRIETGGKSYIYKKGVISIQKDYAQAVKLSMLQIPKIVPALGKLDYCIPGPNPSWEEPTKNNINLIIEYLQNLYFSNGIANSPNKVLKCDTGGENYELCQAGIASLAILNGLTLNIVSGIYNALTVDYKNALAKQDRDRVAAKEAEFERQRAAAIADQKDSFKWYKERIDKLYGPESLMRTADQNNPFYLPMAEAGLQATKYLSLYDTNTKQAIKDYKDLVDQTNANIYKLNVIKSDVDKIVAAARKRQFANAAGLPMVDPSCYDLNGIERPILTGVDSQAPQGNNGGVAQGPGAGTTGGVNKGQTAATGAAPSGNNGTVTNTASTITPNFETKVIVSSNGCQATIITTNKTIGTPADIAWGMKLNPNPTVYSSKAASFSKTIDIYDGNSATQGTLTLTTKDSDGKASSLSKTVSIPKHSKVTQTATGMTCK